MSELKTEQTAVLVEYGDIQISLAAIKEEYEGKLYDVTTTTGLKEAKVDRALFRTGRTDVEKVRKALKAPHLEQGRKIESDANMIKEAFAELEKPVAALIKAEEDKKAAAKAERGRIERERVEDIQDRINGLRFNLSEYHPSEDIQEFMDGLDDADLSDGFMEFAEMAATVMRDSRNEAEAAWQKAKDREQAAEEQAVEKKRLAAEKAELDKQRKEQAAKQKELDEAEAKALSEDAAKDQTKSEKFVAGTAAVMEKARNGEGSLGRASDDLIKIRNMCEELRPSDEIIKDIYEVCAAYIGGN